MIVSPLNYPGNKARILKHIIPYFLQSNLFVNVFCGSGIVGLNSKATKLLLNDKNKQIISLLRFLKSNDLKDTLSKVYEIIADFGLTDSKNMPKNFYKIYKHEGLSLYNKAGFLKLRTQYNKAQNDIMLFVLILYGFNHYLRFNSKGEFNVPVGKMDFSASLYKKSIDFINALSNKDIDFSNLDFRDDKLYENGDFFYFDPPYLITNAPYNATWNENDEKDLYRILDFLNKNNKKFALSNVLLSNGKKNDILEAWAKKYKVIEIKRTYTNANYRRKNLSQTIEVLIKNY